MKKILLITQGHTPNIGDYAIERCGEEFFKSQGFEVISAPYEIQISEKLHLTGKLAVLTNKIFSRFYFLNDIWHRKRIKSLLASAVGNNTASSGTADSNTTGCNTTGSDICCAVIGGGELISNHKGFNSSFYNWCKVLSDMRIPIAVHGVSGDINMSDRLLERYRVSLQKCFRVSVRDRKTAENFKKAYGFDPFYSPDVVFAFPKLSAFKTDGSHKRESPKNSNSADLAENVGNCVDSNIKNVKNVLCIPVPYTQDMAETIGTRDEREYFDYLINAAFENVTADKQTINKQTAANQTAEIRLNITSTVAGDMDFVQRFADYAQNHARNYSHKRAENQTENSSKHRSENNAMFKNKTQNLPKMSAKAIPFAQFDDFLKLLDGADLIVSARMHACILGLLKNRKIFAVPFREKLKTFKDEHADSQNAENLRKIADESYAGLCALSNEIKILAKE